MTSQSRVIRSQNQKNHEICGIRTFDFLRSESKCDFTDVSAQIYDRKMDARPFDAIHDIVRCLSIVKSLLKGRNAPIWRKWEPTHMRLSGTERLTPSADLLTPGRGRRHAQAITIFNRP